MIPRRVRISSVARRMKSGTDGESDVPRQVFIRSHGEVLRRGEDESNPPNDAILLAQWFDDDQCLASLLEADERRILSDFCAPPATPDPGVVDQCWQDCGLPR